MTDARQVVEQRMAAVEEAELQRERNEVRTLAGEWLMMWVGRKADELPPGVKSDTLDCVFAHALGGSFGGSSWTPGDNSSDAINAVAKKIGFTSVELPPVVREFIQRFDRGEYPDLEQYRGASCD